MNEVTQDAMVFTVLGILLGGCLVVLIIECNNSNLFETEDIPEQEIIIPNSEQEIIDNCKNLTLEDSARCLRDEIKSFYIFNETDDTVNLTLDDIKRRGGDCRDYSFLYEKLAKGLGFNSTTIRHNGIKDVHPAHRWAVVWDNETYCKLDQLKVNCRNKSKT